MSVFESLVYHIKLCDLRKLPKFSLSFVFLICKMGKIILLYRIVEWINVVVYPVYLAKYLALGKYIVSDSFHYDYGITS